MKAALAAALGLGLLPGGGACSGKKRAPEGDKGSAALSGDAGAAGSAAAGDAAEASPKKWQRESAPLELDCDGAPAKPAGKNPSKPAAAAPAEPAAPPLPRAELMKECQGQASVEEACGCLAMAMTPSGGVASCEVAEPEPREREPKARSERGRLESVWSGAGERDTLDKGRTLVLLARRGSTWSALQVVDSSDEVDRTETPQTSDLATVRRYEELPFGGGTLF